MRVPAILRSRYAMHAGLAAAGLIAGVLLFDAILKRPEVAAWVALVAAVPALAISCLTFYKARILEFRPQVIAGDVILPRLSHSKGGAKLLLPIQFSNAGYADGIVEWTAIRLTLDGRTERSVLLSPVAEVDMAGFIHAQRQVTTSNTIDPFTAFALEGKRSVAKFVLFDVAERERGEYLELRPGRYTFELFLKAGGWLAPRLECSFEHVIDEKQIEEYRNDVTVYLINYNITLPSVRRQLAAAEWLPREAQPGQLSQKGV